MLQTEAYTLVAIARSIDTAAASVREADGALSRLPGYVAHPAVIALVVAARRIEQARDLLAPAHAEAVRLLAPSPRDVLPHPALSATESLLPRHPEE